MPLSSLIFVVILAVWAVYLVQHWVRRRDHLATARSVDRFSESMRVLERRRALPRPELTETAPRSYSFSPLRPARPEVVVKPVATATSAAGATAVRAPRTVRRARAVARLRAACLLVGSLTMVTLVALALARVLPPWSSLVGIGVLGACVGAVRLSTMQTRSSTRSSRPAPHRAARPAGEARVVAEGAPARRTVPTAPATEHALERQTLAVTARPARTARRSVQTAELYDIASVEAQAAAPAAADTAYPVAASELPAAQEAPEGSWQPVPVPPPTYTLKAKAYRPTAQGSELPADGTVMALDEEFEELPRIESVG